MVKSGLRKGPSQGCGIMVDLRDSRTPEQEGQISDFDFPHGSVIKTLPASTGERGSIPGAGRFHMPRSS